MDAPTPKELVKAATVLVRDPEVAARVLHLLTPRATGRIRHAEDVVQVVQPHLAGRTTEALVAVALDQRCSLIDSAVLTTGTAIATMVDPGQVYRWALTRTRPTSLLVLAHNHPTGDPTPSEQDIEITARLARVGSLLGIPLRDHVIVTDHGGFVSLAEHGYLPVHR